jgi:hypothetical protein
VSENFRGPPHHVRKNTGNDGLSRKLGNNDYVITDSLAVILNTELYATFKIRGVDVYVQLFKISYDGGDPFFVGHEVDNPGGTTPQAGRHVPVDRFRRVYMVTPMGSRDDYTVVMHTEKE